uniref:Non-specific serine/threonine protein kinase n=2 Tax=Caenorhabditis japonica TaxID=281687 RepID=A0A8R1DPG9_CAEJA
MGLQREMPLAQLGEPFGITPAAIENVSPGIEQCKDAAKLDREMPLAQLGEPFGITPAAIENVSPGIEQCKDAAKLDVTMRSEIDCSADSTNTFMSSIQRSANTTTTNHSINNTSFHNGGFAAMGIYGKFEMLTGHLPFQGRDRNDTMTQILKSKLSMPHFLTQEAQSLLRALFKRNAQNRLGAGPDGVEEIKKHPFFAKIDFVKLLNKEIDPPFKPALSTVDSTSYFDPEFTKRTPKDSPALPASATGHEIFRGFSFVSNAVMEARKKIEKPVRSVPTAKTQPFTDDYEILEKIGTGAHSVVHKCQMRATRRKYAVKIVKKAVFDATEEVDILLRHSHQQFIVKLFDVYEDEAAIYMVEELCEGGELLDRLVNRKALGSEKEVASVMANLLYAVQYLHSQQVAHRDLTAANILFATKDGDPSSLRIVDFGFAKQSRAENGMLMTPCYTAQFVAPEVLRKQGYDRSCDVWSLGVLLHTMLTGFTPFAMGPNDTPDQILQRVGDGKISMNQPVWGTISDDAKDLIRRMLDVDPNRRLTAKQALQHKWIWQKEALPDKPITEENGEKLNMSNVKVALEQTYKAIASAPSVKLRPVGSSALAKRRMKDLILANYHTKNVTTNACYRSATTSPPVSKVLRRHNF